MQSLQAIFGFERTLSNFFLPFMGT